MKQASEIDKILQLKMIWAKMMDHEFFGLSPVIEPYEDLLCETFEGCWLHNYRHIPREEAGEKYELVSETIDGRKYYYTLEHHTDEEGREEVTKLGWESFFDELILNERLWASDFDLNFNRKYLKSAKLSDILKKIS